MLWARAALAWWLLECGRCLAAPESAHCSVNESDANNAKFMDLGGKHAAACPKSQVWLAPLASDCLPELAYHAALVVGGNKGYDCVGWARLVTGNPALSAAAWTARLEAVTGSETIPCGECKQCRIEYPVSSSEDEPVEYGFVGCVEPLPANVDVLEKAGSASPWLHAISMIPKAAMDVANGTAPFPDADLAFGVETWGVRRRLRAGGQRAPSVNGRGKKKDAPYQPPRRPATPSQSFRQVAVTTVDETVAGVFRGRVPPFLSVDAEGNDALVLRGARDALSSGGVKYLEFEHQRYRAWSTLLLEDTIKDLDGLGYECFWALDKGKLIRITRCWHPSWTHKHSWSNVVCARRADSCWISTLRRFAAGA